MRRSPYEQPMISAIIPAYNEEKTISAVVTMIRRHPLIDEVIVIDDGSTDHTKQAALSAGAFVASFPANQGKAQAMQRGVELAKHDILFFADADLVGLTHDMLRHIFDPVLKGHYDLCVGIRDRRMYRVNSLFRLMPLLGGERVLTREVWNKIPDEEKQKFQIEIAMNYYTKLYGKKMGAIRLPGLKQVIKEKKYGFIRGFIERIKMIKDILAVTIRLYVFYSMISVIRRARVKKSGAFWK